MLRKYEMAFLLREGEASHAAMDRIKKSLTKIDAKIVKEGDMGNRDLAYEIRKNRERFHRAFYYIVNTENDSEQVVNFEAAIQYDADIIRYMINAEN